jgi:hypothetical protein
MLSMWHGTSDNSNNDNKASSTTTTTIVAPVKQKQSLNDVLMAGARKVALIAKNAMPQSKSSKLLSSLSFLTSSSSTSNTTATTQQFNYSGGQGEGSYNTNETQRQQMLVIFDGIQKLCYNNICCYHFVMVDVN